MKTLLKSLLIASTALLFSCGNPPTYPPGSKDTTAVSADSIKNTTKTSTIKTDSIRVDSTKTK